MSLADLDLSAKRPQRQPTRSTSATSAGLELLPNASQWRQTRPGTFEGCGSTCPRLPAGAYQGHFHSWKGLTLSRKELPADDYLAIPGCQATDLIQEVRTFWSLAEQWCQHGFLQRRGYLLYGPPGSGKTALVRQLLQVTVAADGLALLCPTLPGLPLLLQQIRQVEPDRPVLCVLEDLDQLIADFGVDDLLAFLDGTDQVDHVLTVATTNFPEMLDRRLLARPRRFDRVVKLEVPTEAIRAAYFTAKVPDLAPAELSQWVERTAGLSFAALAEVVIAAKLLGQRLAEVVEGLRCRDDRLPTSREYDRRPTVGFGTDRNGKASNQPHR